MFEAITVIDKKKEAGARLDIGFLLECLLFYKKVHVVVNEAGLCQLLRAFGEQSFVDLLSDGVLAVQYEHDLLAIWTQQNGTSTLHHPVCLNSPDHSLPIALRKACRLVASGEKHEKKMVAQILPKLSNVKRDKALIDASLNRLADNSFITEAAKHVMQDYYPSYDKEIHFQCHKLKDGFIVDTNVPFGFLNSVRVAHGKSEISPASFLSEICNVEDSLSLAAANLSEIATSPVGNKLLGLRFSQLVQRFENASSKRVAFKDVVLKGGNFSHGSLIEDADMMRKIVKMILAAGRFKEWLASCEPSANIVHEYYNKVTEPSFFDKIPGKTLRWSVFSFLGMAADMYSGGGVTGTLIANSVGAFDTFYMDKVLKGWRPSHFIEELKPLIGSNKC